MDSIEWRWSRRGGHFKVGKHEEISVCKQFKGLLWEEEIKRRGKETMVREKDRR